MNVLFVTTSLTREAGGLFDAVHGLAVALLGLGHAVAAMGVKPRGHAGDLKKWRPVTLLTGEAHGPASLAWSPGMTRLELPFVPDVIHFHGLWSHQCSTARRLARKHRCPFFISPHGMLDPWILSRGRVQKRLARWWYVDRAVADASGLQALSEQEQRDILAAYPDAKVFIAPNGVDSPSSTAHPCPWPPALAGKRVLLFLGRLHSKKGVRQLMEAFDLLRVSHPEAHRGLGLAIAGFGDDTLAAEVERWAARPDNSGSVVFLGPRFGEGKAACFQHAAGFILPSFGEGLPMAVLEAWSYGLPSILTDQCNLPDGFCHGISFRCTTEPSSIRDALVAFSSLDESRLHAIAETARQVCRTNYGWESIARAVSARYELALRPR
ncbi:MAG: glycosyltransferase [Chthoniobacteraceae bacterium]